MYLDYVFWLKTLQAFLKTNYKSKAALNTYDKQYPIVSYKTENKMMA